MWGTILNTILQVGKLRPYNYQASELGLEPRYSDSRISALNPSAMLTCPEFFCCPLDYKLHRYLCHQWCFISILPCFPAMSKNHLFKTLPPWTNLFYLPTTIYIAYFCFVLIFTGIVKMGMQIKKWTVSARTKAFHYGKGRVLSSDISRSHKSSDSSVKKQQQQKPEI